MHKKYNKIETYGLWGFLKLLWALLCTKIFYPKARIIRRPIDIRGKKFIHFGEGLTTGKGCRIEAIPFFSKDILIRLGKDIEINDFVHIAAISSVTIGDHVLIASKVFISDIVHGAYGGNAQHDHPDTPPRDRPLTAKQVVIEDNVWIGESVSILPGVTIGKGTIIGANSVVTKSLPPNVIAVGIPAKPIKKYNLTTQRWEEITD
ncbi:MAG TPA: DapH/DapD/GlmU-related protein [Bacteroidales bacterium]|nr:DapH/DapD/GlmU-related protein [Bacteroidales bacterium]